MPPTFRGQWKSVLLLAVVSLIGVAVAYRESLDFGFRYDDYHMVRPWTPREVVSVLYESWDPTEIEPRFYRPLAGWWYAFRFSLFGLNAFGQHLVSLGGMALCATLAGLFVLRETRRLYAAVFAAGLYAVHPVFVYAQAIWLTNQMHLWASVIVLGGLLVWQRARRIGGAAWWWLLVVQVVAFGFKEDTIMLLPLVFALTVLRRWTFGEVRLPPPRVLFAAAIIVLALPYWRYVALGKHVGGYGVPGFDKGWSNFSRGLDVLLQRPARRPWQGVAGMYSLACVTLGTAVAGWRRHASSLHLLGCGALIAICFNLPFYLVAKAEQYHLVGLGCVIVIAGGLDALQCSWRSKAVRNAVGAAGVAGALSFLPVTRHIATDFSPCTASTLYTDDIVLGWWVVPFEIKEWLRQKPAVCKTGIGPLPLTDALSTATWAHGRETDETGSPAHWTSDYAVVLMRRDVSRVNVAVRSPVASKESPTTVTLEWDGGTYRIVLTDSRWRTQTVRMSSTLGSWLRGMHRLDVHVSPVFKASERFGNNDRRILGVLMRVPQPF